MNINYYTYLGKGENPSDEICSQCGIYFGYVDMKGDEFRKLVYKGWRGKWILEGKKFWRNITK